MKVARETARSLGAVIGLSLGFLIMWAVGLSGLVAAFCFGAGGAVLGGMTGERLADSAPRT